MGKVLVYLDADYLVTNTLDELFSVPTFAASVSETNCLTLTFLSVTHVPQGINNCPRTRLTSDETKKIPTSEDRV